MWNGFLRRQPDNVYGGAKLALRLFAILMIQHVGRKLIQLAIPLIRVGTAPAATLNVVLLALMVIGLALSLWPRHRAHSA
jgi:hypothetical protein